jgi:hypothetical protein
LRELSDRELNYQWPCTQSLGASRSVDTDRDPANLSPVGKADVRWSYRSVAPYNPGWLVRAPAIFIAVITKQAELALAVRLDLIQVRARPDLHLLSPFRLQVKDDR